MTYGGVEQDEQYSKGDQVAEGCVILVSQHHVELAGKDTHLVNDQLL